MNDVSRRAVAFIASNLILGHALHEIYDPHERKHFPFTAHITPQQIQVYEPKTSLHIIGSPHENGWALYNLPAYKYIQLEVKGASFSGYDFASRRHFSGTVHEHSVTVYDFENSLNYHYSL